MEEVVVQQTRGGAAGAGEGAARRTCQQTDRRGASFCASAAARSASVSVDMSIATAALQKLSTLRGSARGAQLTGRGRGREEGRATREQLLARRGAGGVCGAQVAAELAGGLQLRRRGEAALRRGPCLGLGGVDERLRRGGVQVRGVRRLRLGLGLGRGWGWAPGGFPLWEEFRRGHAAA